MLKKIILFGLTVSLIVVAFSGPAQAQFSEDPFPEGTEFDNLELPEYPDDEFFRAKVFEIVEEGETDFGGTPQPFQNLKVEMISGSEKGQTQEIDYGTNVSLQESQLLKVGDEVLVAKIYD